MPNHRSDEVIALTQLEESMTRLGRFQ